MRLNHEINTASKIALVFVTVTGTVSFLGKLIAFVPVFSDNNPRLLYGNFFRIHLAWLIIMLSIISGLCFYIKKTEGELKLTFLQDTMIRITVGLLIIIDGMNDLSTKVPILIVNIQTLQQARLLSGEKFDDILNYSLASDAIQILLYLLQTLLGFLFIIYKKKNREIIENND